MSGGTATPRYTPLPADRSQADVERELLARWDEERLFEQTLAATQGGDPFVFFEGPPTANGRPGIHHVFARTIKDLFCRHRAMHGRHVARKAGWDTHGLPVEIEVEKQLGISGKQQIEAIGVEEFNRRCRESVFTYRADWEKLSARIAYWLDYDRPYVTFSNDYVESVWWALATLFDRDLLYRGYKILPYCPRCGTSLSSHEVAQGYQDVEDPSVYVALPLEGGAMRRILVWTTTPWTLVSNAALAVKGDLDYAELVRRTGEDKRSVILAESRVAAVLGADWADRWEVRATLKGTQLVGLRYERPLDWVPYPSKGAHEVIVAEDFVSADDGTGVVHMSPAFGADDYAAGQRHDLAFLQPVDAQGRFPADLPLIGGMFFKEADPAIVEELQRRGVLFKAQRFVHSYPHCWRCGTPLLYYARTSWFVRTTAYRDGMLARNARVDWHPAEIGAGRFGEWLENNIDWAVSRERYWGTPLPLWVCDAHPEHVESVGSYARLAERSGQPLPEGFDPHKPFIDAYHWPCDHPGCTGTKRRTPEVVDTWFDSGSMPFAQWHYPFENHERLAAQYPADFIAEGVDQTRGWFYSMLAIATGLGDALPNNTGGRRSGDPVAAPYRSVVVNDLVLDASGQKMSKSRGNAVDPWAVIDRHGADAVRLFLVASSKVWVPRRFDEAVIREQAGKFLRTLKNVYSGIFAQYANFGWTPGGADPAVQDRPLGDRWILSRLAMVEAQVDAALTEYDATVAATALIQFVDDDVANWYVRLNRARFYAVDDADNRAAFATLHEVLVVTCRLLAPFCPFVSDWMHRELAGGSVHLAPFVRADAAGTRDERLEAAMAAIRTLATLGRAAREQAGIKVRQPLARMVVVAPRVGEAELTPLLPLLAAELNVHEVVFASSGDALVTLEGRPNFRTLGKKFGKATPEAAREVAALSSETLRKFAAGESVEVTAGGVTRALDPEDVELRRLSAGELVVAEELGFFAAVDPAVTPALQAEGRARELVSRIQRLRKESGFEVGDRIVLTVAGPQEVHGVLDAHGPWIASEVLATELVREGALSGTNQATQTVDLDGITAAVAITRVG